MSFTANPRAPKVDPSQVPREPTGPVAADSLAAESLDRLGGFSENARAAASSVTGGASTLNNTDTSGATVLPPAADGTTREERSALGLGPDEKGVSGVKLDALPSGTSTADPRPAGPSDFGATTTTTTDTGPDPNIKSSSAAGSTGGTSTTTRSTGGASASAGATGGGVRPHVDAAPGYIASVTGAAIPHDTYKPKGANLEDADETDGMPKPKTFTGDVGGQHDPSRSVERDFEARNAAGPVEQNSSSGVPGGAQRQAGDAVGEQGGKFGVLDSERA